MRTTLDIDDDMLAAARELAARKRSNMGAVVSELMRTALRREPETTVNRNGITVFARRGLTQPVTLDVVNRLRDELP
ncbi:MAG: CopG family transcriptional regulator [Janthinobacterium lividum]